MDAVVVVGTVDDRQRADVGRLLDAAAVADGKAAVSEQGRLALRGPRAGVRHLLQYEGPALVGYGQIDGGGTAELVVDPARRGEGYGRALVGAVVSTGAERVWAHGGHPAARHLAAALGMELVRELRQMRRSLPVEQVQAELPDGVTLRTFVPGQDEDEWLGLNGRAFAKHPEQGGWTRHDLELREQEPWFDPAGFFIAERDGRMTGFHWTKVHDPFLGEVYVVGVDPAEQGTGLGRALTLAGLRHLRDLGLARAMLYVDEDNVPAIRMYEALGFTQARVDAMYRSASPGGRPPGG